MVVFDWNSESSDTYIFFTGSSCIQFGFILGTSFRCCFNSFAADTVLVHSTVGLSAQIGRWFHVFPDVSHVHVFSGTFVVSFQLYTFIEEICLIVLVHFFQFFTSKFFYLYFFFFSLWWNTVGDFSLKIWFLWLENSQSFTCFCRSSFLLCSFDLVYLAKQILVVLDFHLIENYFYVARLSIVEWKTTVSMLSIVFL